MKASTAPASSGAVPAKLVIEGLSRRYGSVTALEPTDLSVQAGEFLTLLGPSGSGKTTLLQMVCGLVEPSSGRVLIDGRDETATPVHRRDVGLVFQHYALFPHLTVTENVEFPLRMRGRPPAEVKKRAAEALAMVKLDELAGRFPRELSGGQQQRVALARCFVYQPSIILMDEPLGALDRKLREHMQIEIKRLHRETGATIIYVTHDQEEALALSDRICLMNLARVEQVGTPREIYARPRTTFAADFVGVSNIFRGRFETGADGLKRLVTPHGTFRLPAHVNGATDSTVLVVRPEHLTIGVAEGGAADGNMIAGRVTDTVFAGAETRVIASLDGGETVTARLGQNMPPPALGERVTLGWHPDAAVLVN